MLRGLLPGLVLSAFLAPLASAGTLVIPDPLGDTVVTGHTPLLDIAQTAVTVTDNAVDIRLTYEASLTPETLKNSMLVLELGTRPEHRGTSRIADWGLEPIETVNYFVEFIPFSQDCEFVYFDDDHVGQHLPNLPATFDRNTVNISVPRSHGSPLQGLLLGSSFELLILTFDYYGLGDICWENRSPYVIPVPEPATGLAGLLGLIALGRGGRRRYHRRT